MSMQAYSLDLRQKILGACDQRLGSPRTIAALCGVSQSVVAQLRRRRRASGDISPRPHAGGRRAICDTTA
jgi:transposase